MYDAIREHPSVRTLYGRKLAEAGVVTPDAIEQLAEGYRDALDEGRNPNQAALGMIGNQYTVDWSRYTQAALGDSVATGLPDAEIRRLAGAREHGARGLEAPSARAAHRRRSAQDGGRRGRLRLGLRRDARLRLAARRRTSTCG